MSVNKGQTVVEKFEQYGYTRIIPGLRTDAPPSECAVFESNPDGTKGKFLRFEPPYQVPVAIRQQVSREYASEVL